VTEKAAAAIERLMQLHPKGFDLSLDRIRGLLEKLGNPHLKLPPVILPEPTARDRRRLSAARFWKRAASTFTSILRRTSSTGMSATVWRRPAAAGWSATMFWPTP